VESYPAIKRAEEKRLTVHPAARQGATKCIRNAKGESQERALKEKILNKGLHEPHDREASLEGKIEEGMP